MFAFPFYCLSQLFYSKHCSPKTDTKLQQITACPKVSFNGSSQEKQTEDSGEKLQQTGESEKRRCQWMGEIQSVSSKKKKRKDK